MFEARGATRMMTEAEAILSALIDREAVDPDALAFVLEQPESRALLVDFVRLRSIVSDESERLREGKEVRHVHPRRIIGMRRVNSHVRRHWTRAAAIVTLIGSGVGGGVWFGQRHSDTHPPAPSHVVRFERGVDWQVLEPGTTAATGR